MQSRGWVSPFGRGEDGLMHQIGAFTLLTLGGEDKLLPPAVVNEDLADKLEALKQERGKPVGGRERKRLKDEALMDLLPRAFVRPVRLSGYIDARHGLGRGRHRLAQGRRGLRFGAAGDRRQLLVAVPPDPEEAPRSLMTGWLTGAKLPEGFELGDECELKDPADRGAIVRARRQDLESSRGARASQEWQASHATRAGGR